MHLSKLSVCIKLIFFASFFVILICGFILLISGYTPQTELYGYYTNDTIEIPTNPSEIIKTAGDGSLFLQIEKNYNEKYPLRPVAIRINNTIDFLQGKSSNDNVWYGKNLELYEYEYISDCLMLDNRQNGYYNADKIEDIVNELSFIRDAFHDMNKEIYVLITPNKAVFTKDHIPDELLAKGHKEQDGKYIRNIAVLKEQLEKNHIPYFDSTSYIQNILPDNVIAFYRSGIHYSWPAGYYIAQAMFRDIEEKTGMIMPRFKLSVKNQEDVVFPNHDLYDLLNTIQNITDYVYSDQPQQQVYIDDLQKSSVGVVMQGGSFLGPYIDMHNRYEPFHHLEVIQNQLFLTNDHNIIELKSIEDVDLNRIINNRLFIFEVNEDAASGMSFGFIHYLYKALQDADTSGSRISAALDFSQPDTLANASVYGIYDLDATSLNWRFTNQRFGCTIQNSRIKDRGLQISTFITDDLRSRAADRQVSIEISINNHKIGSFEPDNEGMIL